MKLLFCKNCCATFSLSTEKVKSCDCGETSGKYLDTLNAVYKGDDAVPLGFKNSSFLTAVALQPKDGYGDDFGAFVIAQECETFVKVDEIPEE